MKQKLKGMCDYLKSQETIKPGGTINWKGVHHEEYSSSAKEHKSI